MKFVLFKRNYSTIPIIDFGAFLKGGHTEKQTIGFEIVNAFKDMGFIYLTNHGIPKTLVDSTFDQSKSFFDLDQCLKDELAWKSPQANRGYVTFGREKTTLHTNESQIDHLRRVSPDLKESMEIGKEPSFDYQNNWPMQTLPSFQTHMIHFYNVCHDLHLNIMSAIGLGLGLNSGYFVPFCNAKDHNLRLLHYPKVSKDVLRKPGQSRTGAHSDYGTITLLFQDSVGGLQVKTNQGNYIEAPPIPDTIVINAGDLLARWSNDIIKSTEHQVVSPPYDPHNEMYPDRYSIAYFCNPNWNANIDAIDGTWDTKHPKKYPSITCHDYLVQRLSQTY